MADRTKRHREAPLKRTNPSGKTVWVARYTDPDGVRRLSSRRHVPDEGRRAGAIDAAYELPASAPETLGAYAATWLERWPRSERTNATNEHRLSRVLDVAIEGRPLRDWPYRELKRRHASTWSRPARDQGRAREGAVGILRVLSAMTENAITDEIAEVNAFKGVRVKPTTRGSQGQARAARLQLRGAAPLRQLRARDPIDPRPTSRKGERPAQLRGARAHDRRHRPPARRGPRARAPPAGRRRLPLRGHRAQRRRHRRHGDEEAHRRSCRRRTACSS
jgi:hypothetical protein